MAQRSTLWLAGGFAAALALMGIPYWLIPYNYQGFPYPGLVPGMIGLAVATAVLVAASPASIQQIFWTMMAAYPAATAIRVLVEGMEDPTDHNLWPFELIYAGVVSLVAVVPGLLVGWLARRTVT